VPADHAIAGAPVGPDTAARRVEDHYGVGVIEGAPSGIAGAGWRDPGRVHPAG